jgi:hypothetical protein
MDGKPWPSKQSSKITACNGLFLFTRRYLTTSLRTDSRLIDKKEFADVTIHAPIMKALENLRKALT